MGAMKSCRMFFAYQQFRDTEIPRRRCRVLDFLTAIVELLQPNFFAFEEVRIPQRTIIDDKQRHVQQIGKTVTIGSSHRTLPFFLYIKKEDMFTVNIQ
jgi:hypothetical protein